MVEMERLGTKALKMQLHQLENHAYGYENSIAILEKKVEQLNSTVPAAELLQLDILQNVEHIRHDYEQTSEHLSYEYAQRADKFYAMWQSEVDAADELRDEVERLQTECSRLSRLQMQNRDLQNRIDTMKRDNLVLKQKTELLQNRSAAASRQIADLRKVIPDDRTPSISMELYDQVEAYRQIVEEDLLDEIGAEATD